MLRRNKQQDTRMNWREDGESKSEGKRVRMNGGGGGWRAYEEGRQRWRGETVKENQREYLRECMDTHVSRRPKTSASCKNNLSNYEERLFALLPRMPSCTPSLDAPPRALPSYIHPLYIFRCRDASDNVIPENRLELFTVFYKDGLFCQYPTAGQRQLATWHMTFHSAAKKKKWCLMPP